MKDKPAQTADTQEVPVWIVSFSDMVTLLLAFFVLLQAFAKIRDPELFFQGQGSFRKALKNFGLPAWMLGRENRPAREYAAVRYTTEPAEDVKPKNDLIDGEMERIQEVFARLKRAMDVQATDPTDRLVGVMTPDLRFAGGRAELDEASRAVLRRYALDLQAGDGPGRRRVVVVGLADGSGPSAETWRLSALRAQVVAEFLSGELGADGRSGRWRIESWGTGTGERWCRDNGLKPGQTHVALVLMETGD
ncbi:MAG TPA: flagellar motor protein MotB [Phycisphaerae bacterium]|nr:flagellar motor protein MotB [Phycisphaerae bacterium]